MRRRVAPSVTHPRVRLAMENAERVPSYRPYLTAEELKAAFADRRVLTDEVVKLRAELDAHAAELLAVVARIQGREQGIPDSHAIWVGQVDLDGDARVAQRKAELTR